MESPRRLYLSKGKELVYIDKCELPQYHIDGIRFLYRLFKKNKSGVILNDPTGSNKEVQIVLFLSAVRHLLDKTILVLCPEGSEQDWLQLFWTWTDLGDDVVIETAKPYLKKKVIINGMVNLPSFSQQAWSIVVVTDDSPPNTVLKYTFKADYKIWNTSVNIKKNLGIFTSIYAWLNQDKVKSKNPMEKFNISEFTPDRNNLRDVIDKAVRLDAFMEDIVLRRKTIDCNSEGIQNLPSCKASKKNKDATGTKIKRTKRKIHDSELTLAKVIESTVPKLAKPSDVGKEDITDHTLVLEGVSSDHLQGQVEEFNNNLVISQNSDIKLFYETDTMNENDKIYEMDTQVDGTSIEDDNEEIVHNNNQINYDVHCVQQEPKSNEMNEILNSNNANWKVTDIVIQTQDDLEPNVVMDAMGEIEKSDTINYTEEFVTEKQSIIESETTKAIMQSENDITTANNIIKEDDTMFNVSVGNDKDMESSDVKDEDLDDIDLKNNQCKEQAMKRFKGSILDSIF